MIEETRYDGDVTLRFDENKHNYYVDIPGEDIENEKVPSVTTITGVVDKSGPLLGWYGNLAEEAVKEKLEPGKTYNEVDINNIARYVKSSRWRSTGEAQDVGVIAHNICEDYVTHKTKMGKCKVLDRGDQRDFEGPHVRLPHEDRAYKSCKSFFLWTKEHEINWLKAEKMTFSRSKMVAGTTDAIALIDGDLTVCDWKTSSSGVYFSHALQCAGAYVPFLEEEYPMEVDQALVLQIPKNGGKFNPVFFNRDEIEYYTETFNHAHSLWNAKDSWSNR